MKVIKICYVCAPNLGSENQLGFLYANANGNQLNFTICPSFEFNKINLKERKIKNLKFKILNKNIFIKLGGPQYKPKFERITYQLWIIKIFFKFFLKNKYLLHFVTYNQTLTFNPFHFFNKENTIFGPLGGQAELYRFKFFSLNFRTRNFIINKLYKICSLNYFKNRVFFCHPKLSKKFNSNIYFPTVNLGDIVIDENDINYNDFLLKKRNIVFVGKKIEIKLYFIVEEAFKFLANVHKDYNFMIIGYGENEEKNKNLIQKPYTSRNEVLEIFKKSYLNVFPSLELGGYVTAEAAANQCPNLLTSGYGGDLVFNNRDKYRLEIYENNTKEDIINMLIKKITNIIIYKDLNYKESLRQKKIITNQNIKSIENFLHKIYRSC